MTSAEKESNDRIGTEAGHWLLSLEESVESEERNQAFFEWLKGSPAHCRIFMETFEAYRLLGTLDTRRTEEIHALLQHRGADVIQLYGGNDRRSVARAGKPRRRYGLIGFVAAGVLAVTLGAISAWNMYGPKNYATAIGEQRSFNLEDGSVVVLNTHSRAKVVFSKHARNIELLQGEALFTVEHDARRPFVVNTGAASILAVGTQFNVRRRREQTDVAVVEGVVQVNARGAEQTSPTRTPYAKPATATRLIAGEEAAVASGQVSKVAKPEVANKISWRARRLVFTNASFPDVAAEFNRYNQAQVRIEGSAQAKRLSGIFDADRPRAFVLYATRDRSLAVDAQGDDWVIRGQ